MNKILLKRNALLFGFALLPAMTSILVLAGCGRSPAPPSNVLKTSVPQPGSTESESVAESNAVAESGVVEASAEAASDAVASDTVAAEAGSGAVVENDAIEFGNKFPEVLAVEVKAANAAQGNSYRFNVTLSSVYDSPQRYADAWRVLDEQDNELSVRVLMHDHASEQPFTRSKVVDVPAGTRIVFVEGRDKANGWSGQRFKVEMPE